MTANDTWCDIFYHTGANDCNSVQIEDWSVDIDFSPTISDLPADNRFGYDLGKVKRTLTLKGVFWEDDNSASEATGLLENLYQGNIDNVNGRKVKIAIHEDSGDGHHHFIKVDGNSSDITWLLEKIRGFKKEAKGEGCLYKIDQLVFRQAGSSSH